MLAFALLIGGAGVVALVRPETARNLIGRFATSWQINLFEQAYRAIAGLALIARAPDAHTPALFTVAGWIIVVTAAMLLILPLRWHSAYAQWWSQNMPLFLLRFAGVVALALAGALGRSAWG